MKLSKSVFSLITVRNVILFSHQTSAITYYNSPCATWSYGGYGTRSTQITGIRSVDECAKYAINNGYAGFTVAWKPKSGYAWEGQVYSNPDCINHCEYEIYSDGHCWMRVNEESDCVHYCADGYGPSWASYIVTAGTNCPLNGDGIYEESLGTSAPSDSPTTDISSAPSDSPTTNFQGKNYEIENLDSEFLDRNGQFLIELDYTVGKNVDWLHSTLFYENCTVPIDGDETIVTLQNTSNDFLREIIVNKEKLSTSVLVARTDGSSKGTLSFCVRAEGFINVDENTGISVSFRKDDFKLSYDLTRNSFEINSNVIEEDEIDTSSKDVTTSYGIVSHRCSSASYESDLTAPTLQQNGLVYICIRPDSTDVEISTFYLNFVQDTYTFEAVKMGVGGWESSKLSSISTDAGRIKIVSRLVTAFFENDKTSFNATGNAYLRFKTVRRKLGTMRMVQAMLEKDSAGEAMFDMNVKIQKTDVTIAEPENIATIAVSVLGSLILISIAFILIKKMKN